MKKKSRFTITLTLFMLIAIASVRSPDDIQASLAYQPGPETIQGFDLQSPSVGWLWMGARLYRTQTAGHTWLDMTPDNLGAYTIRAVTFVDTQYGWLALTKTDASGMPIYATARTANSGRTWKITPHALFEPGEIAAFEAAIYLHFLDTQVGWLVVKQATGSNFSTGTLFRTENGGKTWQRGTLPIGEPVYFATPEVGWVAGGPAENEFYRTQDGGLTWQPQTVSSSTTQGGQERRYQLPWFANEQTGLLPTVVENGNQTELEIYITEDGGNSWQLEQRIPLERSTAPRTRIPLAITDGGLAVILSDAAQLHHLSITGSDQRVSHSNPLSPGIVTLDMVTPTTGWAERQAGECPVDSPCHLETKLLHTTDGGATWTALALPNSNTAAPPTFPTTTLPFQDMRPTLQSAGLTRAFVGQGFDKCEIATLSQLQTWQDNSPYEAVNLYIGGSCRGCANTALSQSYIAQISQQGWTFIPTWVGPQSACWGGGCSSRINNDTTAAYNQGVSEANAAIAVMIDLGLAAPDGSGGIIYYDLEGYDTTNGTCRAAAQSFMSGWVARLHEVGSQAGVYGSACSAAINDFATISHIPDAIWPAHWIYSAYNPDASVWNVACIPDGNWANHQRIRQYAGGHNETWGNVTLNIDSNVIDGVVADITGGCIDAAPVGQDSSRQQMFVDAYNRNGGKGGLGCTENAVHWWNTEMTIQDFTGTDTIGDAIIVHNEYRDNPPNTIPAFVVYGGILSHYFSHVDAYGPPTSDEFANQQGYAQSNFANGYVTWEGGAVWHTWPTSFAQWKAEYYNNTALIGFPTMVRNENVAKPDYDWGEGAPEGGHIGVFADKFSVRWTRTLNFATTGLYRFSTYSDDGVRVWVDNTLIIDHWADGGEQNHTGDINLSAGNHTVKIEYYENGGFAYFEIDWELIPPTSQVAIAIDSPTEGANVEGIITVGGWAIDRASTSGTGVSEVHIYLDGTAGGGGTGLGVAAYGGDRPDVAAVYGSQFRYSGYNYSWNSNNASLGDHTLYVYVYSTIASSWSYYQRQVKVVDTTAPTSAISTLPKTMSNPTFALTWSGSDNGAGIATYDVQVRDGADGTWQDLLVDTTKTTQEFTGEVGHTYYFRCRATDLAGNVESWPNNDGDTYTYIKGYPVFLPMVLR